MDRPCGFEKPVRRRTGLLIGSIWRKSYHGCGFRNVCHATVDCDYGSHAWHMISARPSQSEALFADERLFQNHRLCPPNVSCHVLLPSPSPLPFSPPLLLLFSSLFSPPHFSPSPLLPLRTSPPCLQHRENNISACLNPTET